MSRDGAGSVPVQPGSADRPEPVEAPEPAGTARTYAPDFLLEMFHNPLDAGYADAAQRRASRGPAGAASRRAGFGLRMIALVATGLLLAVAYQQTIAAQPESSKVRAGLVSDVRDRQKDTDALQRRADALRVQVNVLRDAVLVSSQARALRDLEAQVGTGAVTGPGVLVTLSDGPVPVDPVTGKADTNPEHDLGRVLDSDLQVIANELWRDGSEAIAINGQRLTATTAIRTAGDAILVDFVPLTQPYQIVAIGPPDLASRLADSATGDEYARLRDTYGMHYSVASRSNLTAPAATDSGLRYAKPDRPDASPPVPAPTGTATPASPAPTSTPSSTAPSSTGGR